MLQLQQSLKLGNFIDLKNGGKLIKIYENYRNLSADVTRFVPMAVRSKKDEVRKPKPKAAIMDTRHFK